MSVGTVTFCRLTTHSKGADGARDEQVELTPKTTAMESWRRLAEETVIESPSEAVWAVLGAFGDVAAWAPGIASSRCLGTRTGGIGARRLMRHVWGFRLEEVVTAWEEGSGFTFLVIKAPFPLNFVLETWKVAPSGAQVRVETTVEYNTHAGPLGRLIDYVCLRHLIRREMRRGLAGLRRSVGSDQRRCTARTPATQRQ